MSPLRGGTTRGGCRRVFHCPLLPQTFKNSRAALLSILNGYRSWHPKMRKVQQQILDLPNYSEIRRKFRLGGVGMDTDPDPHGFYSRGDQPRRCPCHADLWDQRRNPNRITLSPPWRHALEKTFRVRLADPLVLRDRC